MIEKLLENDHDLAPWMLANLDDDDQEAESCADFTAGIFSEPVCIRNTVPDGGTLTERIGRELRLHDVGDGLGPLLRRCVQRLLSIQPTSVKPERDFSVMNHVCTKSRNALAPATLDNLVFLRAHLVGAVYEPKASESQSISLPENQQTRH
jgi:hypothetical protein